jgi:hypothetical protein
MIIRGYRYGFVGGTCICRSGGATQAIVGFAAPRRLTAHHDDTLADLTDQVNQLVANHPASKGHFDGRELAMILTPAGWMFAWTRNEHDQEWSTDELRSSRVETLETSEESVLRNLLGLD